MPKNDPSELVASEVPATVVRAYLETGSVAAAARVAGIPYSRARQIILAVPDVAERARLVSLRRQEMSARESVELAGRHLRRRLADPDCDIGPSILSRIIVEQSIVEQRAAAASGEHILPGDLDGLRGLELAERLEAEARRVRERARLSLDADPRVVPAEANPLAAEVAAAAARATEGARARGRREVVAVGVPEPRIGESGEGRASVGTDPVNPTGQGRLTGQETSTPARVSPGSLTNVSHRHPSARQGGAATSPPPPPSRDESPKDPSDEISRRTASDEMSDSDVAELFPEAEE